MSRPDARSVRLPATVVRRVSVRCLLLGQQRARVLEKLVLRWMSEQPGAELPKAVVRVVRRGSETMRVDYRLPPRARARLERLVAGQGMTTGVLFTQLLGQWLLDTDSEGRRKAAEL